MKQVITYVLTILVAVKLVVPLFIKIIAYTVYFLTEILESLPSIFTSR